VHNTYKKGPVNLDKLASFIILFQMSRQRKKSHGHQLLLMVAKDRLLGVIVVTNNGEGGEVTGNSEGMKEEGVDEAEVVLHLQAEAGEGGMGKVEEECNPLHQRWVGTHSRGRVGELHNHLRTRQEAGEGRAPLQGLEPIGGQQQ